MAQFWMYLMFLEKNSSRLRLASARGGRSWPKWGARLQFAKSSMYCQHASRLPLSSSAMLDGAPYAEGCGQRAGEASGSNARRLSRSSRAALPWHAISQVQTLRPCLHLHLRCVRPARSRARGRGVDRLDSMQKGAARAESAARNFMHENSARTVALPGIWVRVRAATAAGCKLENHGDRNAVQQPSRIVQKFAVLHFPELR